MLQRSMKIVAVMLSVNTPRFPGLEQISLLFISGAITSLPCSTENQGQKDNCAIHCLPDSPIAGVAENCFTAERYPGISLHTDVPVTGCSNRPVACSGDQPSRLAYRYSCAYPQYPPKWLFANPRILSYSLFVRGALLFSEGR